MFAKKTESKTDFETKEVTTLEGKPEVQKPVVLDEKISEEKKSETASLSEGLNKPQTAEDKGQIELYIETFGWMSTMQSGAKNLIANSDEIKAYIKGVELALEGKETQAKLGEVMPGMQAFLQKRAEAFEKKHQEELKMTVEKNRKAGDEFMKNLLLKDASIKTTASGLSYKIVAEGDIKCKPTDDDTVEIYYVGKLIDEKIFDESKGKSIKFPLNGVIRGLGEGLQLMGKGGKAEFYIPDNLAYGEYDIPGIPAGSRLIFEIELVDIIKAEKSPAPVANDNKEVATEEKTNK